MEEVKCCTVVFTSRMKNSFRNCISNNKQMCFQHKRAVSEKIRQYYFVKKFAHEARKIEVCWVRGVGVIEILSG